MLLGEERDNLSTDAAEALHDLGLLMHFNVEPIGHLIVHDIMSLHLSLLTGQLLTFQLEAVVLSLQELEFLFDAVAYLQDRELEGLAGLKWGRVPSLGVHPADPGSPLRAGM